jgi:hypothetical protein
MATLSEQCRQRRLAQLYNIPPTRLETITPYGGPFSKFDLDMRRKAEVLKYANNASNTKTNNLTKREQFAALSRGGPRASPTTVKVAEVLNCNDNLIQTSTSASGVPGPAIMLYEDASVPLYNYSSNVDSYAQLPPNNNTETFYFVPTSNLALANDVSGQIFAQLFTTLADFQYANYAVNIPIGISVSGTVLDLSVGRTVTFTVTSAKVALYYNSEIASVKTYSGPPLYMTVDLSSNAVPGTAFSVLNQYVGNLTFSQWPVYGGPGYVYQWYVAVKVTFAGTARIGTSYTLRTIVGIGGDVIPVVTNCVVTASSTGANGGSSIVETD